MEQVHHLLGCEIPLVKQAGPDLFHKFVGNPYDVPHRCDQFFVFWRVAGNHAVVAQNLIFCHRYFCLDVLRSNTAFTSSGL